MTKIYTRKGCHDIWNAFMVEEATYSKHDIPFCPTTATNIPLNLISYVSAKSIHKKKLKEGHKLYHTNAYVHFCIDDQKFEGVNSGIIQMKL